MAERNLDFDKIIDRRNTRCLKYDFAKRRGKPEDALPLWVADMDFETSLILKTLSLNGQSMVFLDTVRFRLHILKLYATG